jgi:hypothetical protein
MQRRARPATPVGLSRAEPLGSRKGGIPGLGPSGFHPIAQEINNDSLRLILFS